MDWLELLASLVGSLAWPATVVVILLVFRHQVAGLIPLLRRLRYKDLELEFERGLREVSQKARQEHLEPSTELAETLSHLAMISYESPRAAIFEAWLQVEAAAAAAAARYGIGLRDRERTPMRLGAELRRAEVMDPGILDVYEQLRELRNKVVHGDEITPGSAAVRDYVALALALVDYLQKKRP